MGQGGGPGRGGPGRGGAGHRDLRGAGRPGRGPSGLGLVGRGRARPGAESDRRGHGRAGQVIAPLRRRRKVAEAAGAGRGRERGAAAPPPATPGAAGRGTAAPTPSSRPDPAQRSAMAAEEMDGLAMSRPHYGCEYWGARGPDIRAGARQRPARRRPARPGPRCPSLPGEGAGSGGWGAAGAGQAAGPWLWDWPAGAVGPAGSPSGPRGAARRAPRGAGAMRRGSSSKLDVPRQALEKSAGRKRWMGSAGASSGSPAVASRGRAPCLAQDVRRGRGGGGGRARGGGAPGGRPRGGRPAGEGRGAAAVPAAFRPADFGGDT